MEEPSGHAVFFVFVKPRSARVKTLIARTEQPSIGNFFVRGFSSTKNGLIWNVVFDVFVGVKMAALSLS